MKRQKYEEQPSGASRVAQLILNEVFNPGQGEWLDEHALSGVSALTGKVIRAGRVHTKPRSQLFECGAHRQANRLSVSISKAGKCQFVDEGEGRQGASKCGKASETKAFCREQATNIYKKKKVD